MKFKYHVRTGFNIKGLSKILYRGNHYQSACRFAWQLKAKEDLKPFSDQLSGICVTIDGRFDFAPIG